MAATVRTVEVKVSEGTRVLIELANALRDNVEYDSRGPFLRFDSGKTVDEIEAKLRKIAIGEL